MVVEAGLAVPHLHLVGDDRRAQSGPPAMPQRRAAERRAFCFALVVTVDRSAGVRDGDVRVEAFTPGERRTKSCRLLPPGANRS